MLRLKNFYQKKIKSKVISHKKGLKQGNTPICGIYAFVNGFYDGKNEEDWGDTIEGIWNLSIDNNLQTQCNKNCNEKMYTLTARSIKYSIVGEFFSSDNLYSFLTEEKDNILNELHKADKSIKTYKVNRIHEINFEDISNNKEEIFYLVPINSGFINDTNMHWICLKQCNKKLTVINSAKDRLGEREASTRSIKLFMQIRCISQLQNIWLNMKSREYKSEIFDFIKWRKEHKKIQIPNNKEIITDARIFEYCFCYSKFDVISITVIR